MYKSSKSQVIKSYLYLVTSFNEFVVKWQADATYIETKKQREKQREKVSNTLVKLNS